MPAAGLLRRLAALAYDLLLLASVLIVCTLLGVVIHHGTAITPGSAASLAYRAALAAVTVAFFTGFWTHGQTLGMRAWRLRVTDAAGVRINWRRALLRLAAGLATLLPALAGASWAAHGGRGPWWCWALLAALSYWWALPDPQHLCLHERLSGTRVIRTAPVAKKKARAAAKESRASA